MRATLYVKGVRVTIVKDKSYQGYVFQQKGGGIADPILREYPDYKVYKETTYKSVLPEDQKALIDMVKAAAVKYGFELRVTDVGDHRFLDRLDARLKRISSFPTLVTDTGLRIDGDFTEERIKALFVNWKV